jgi:putative ABC transport system permease protein
MIAAINFTNLSTAQASRRAKEVGIKKIGGSPRGILITQFLSESIILTFVSTVFGLIIVKIIIPYFNQLLGATLKLDLFGTPYLIPSLILFSVIVGVLAGIYPAFVLSSFNPYEVLKGNVKVSMQSGRLRRVLVVFQFTVSIILIVGTILMYRQIKFMLNKDAGFNKEQLIVLENAEALGGKTHAFKDVLKTIPGVVTVTGSNSVPARSNNNNGYMVEGKKDETILLWTNWIDYDYIGTYGMTLLKGRTFNNQYSTDKEACILNEAAIKKFGIDPEKTRIMLYGDSGKVSYSPIIGVVKDFVFESLRNKVGPYIFRLKPDDNYCNYLTLKISGDNYSGTIADIGNKWKEFASDEPFKYHFLDELLELMYLKEKQNARMAIISSILGIFVAALGLFGLTSFTVEQRTKEIGVRKAMGSSITGIYIEISREIIVLISVSAIIACPVIYYLAGRWLENFYYKINLGVFSFLAGLTIALCVAILTISYRVIRAARVNPAQSLKYE